MTTRGMYHSNWVPITEPSKPPRGIVSSALLILVLQMVVSSLSYAAQVAPKPETHLRQLFAAARTAQNRGDFYAAVIDYERIVSIRPDLAEAWTNLGLMRRSLGDYSQADRDFANALRTGPQLYVPNLFLGVDLLRQKRSQEAVTYLERAEELDPADEEAALSLGDAYELLGRYSDATESFFGAVEINPRDAKAWYALGVSCLNVQKSAVERLRSLNLTSGYATDLLAALFLQQGRTNEAIKVYEQILTLRTKPPYTRAALGSAYALNARPSLAEKTFLEELKTNPGCLPARVGLARIALTTGHTAEFLKQLSVAWKADPNFVSANAQSIWTGLSSSQLSALADWLRKPPMPLPHTRIVRFLTCSLQEWREHSSSIFMSSQNLYGKGKVNHSTSAEDRDYLHQLPEELWHSGHYTACETELRKDEVNLQPGHLLLLAECSYYSADYRASLLASESALRANPKSLPALYWSAKAAQELAAYSLARVSVVAPGSSKIHFMLAEVYREEHEIPEAEREYQKAISLNPGDVSARLGRAKLYYEDLELGKEVADLLAVLRQDPRNEEANFLMGEALIRRHESAQAMRYLKTALKTPFYASPLAHSLLAQCYASQGRFREAIAELKQALPQDDDGSYHYQIFRLYRKTGNETDAMAALKQSQSLWKKEQERRHAGR
jgi:tetratricopeptide (TPR) repeat protein